MPGLDLGDDDVPLVIAPHDLRDGEALSDRVQQIVLHVLEALHAAELLLNEGGDLLVPGVVAERDDLEVQAGDGVLPGLELTEQVRVFLLHFLEQLHLPQHVARVGLLEYLRQLDGGEAVAGVFTVFVRHMGDGDLLGVGTAQGRGRGLGVLPLPLSSAHSTASSMRRCAI